MKLFRCYLFISWISVAENVHVQDWSLQIMKDVCPYNRFCTQEPVMNLTVDDAVPCCRQCSCTEDCVYTANCCPDAPVQPNPNNSAFPCLTTSKFLRKRRRPDITTLSFYDSSYRFIDKCPRSERNLTLARLCSKPTDLSDLVVVTSNENGLTYANIHCASCHSQSDVQNWIVYVYIPSCLDFLKQNFRSFNERDAFVAENCTFYLAPPKQSAGTISRCFYHSRQLVSHCNATGLWKVYNRDIEQACENNVSKHYVVSIKQRAGGIVYSNSFCYLCNEAEYHPSSGLCPASVFQEPYDKTHLSMLTIINMYATKTKNHQDCTSSEIYDPLMKTCRELFCPDGKIPFAGGCRPSLSAVSQTSLDVFFLVSFANPMAPQIHAFRTSLVNILRSRVEVLSSECQLCETSLYSDKESEINSLFYLKLTMQTTNHCTLAKLSQNLFTHFINSMSVDVHMYGVSHAVKVSLELEASVKSRTRISEVRHKLMCLNRIRLDHSLVNFLSSYKDCPNILIPTLQLRSIGFNESFIKSLETVLEDADFKRLCIGEYMAAARDLNKNLPSGESGRKHCQATTVSVLFLVNLLLVTLRLSL